MKYSKSNKKSMNKGMRPGNENSHSMGGMNYRPDCGHVKQMGQQAPKGIKAMPMKKNK